MLQSVNGHLVCIRSCFVLPYCCVCPGVEASARKSFGGGGDGVGRVASKGLYKVGLVSKITPKHN